jgi:hypothetical protein
LFVLTATAGKPDPLLWSGGQGYWVY